MLALVLLQDEPRYDEDSFKEFSKKVLEKEPRAEWKKIQWQKNMDDALKAAQKDNKPIFVFLVVGEKAQKNAEKC